MLEPATNGAPIRAGSGRQKALGKGYVEMMMRRAFQVCFAEPSVTAIVIDPLTSAPTSSTGVSASLPLPCSQGKCAVVPRRGHDDYTLVSSSWGWRSRSMSLRALFRTGGVCVLRSICVCTAQRVVFPRPSTQRGSHTSACAMLLGSRDASATLLACAALEVAEDLHAPKR